MADYPPRAAGALFDNIQIIRGSDGRIHNDSGPAVIFSDGSTQYYQHGHLHRTDGPAIKTNDGIIRWFLNGTEYKFDQWLKAADLKDSEKAELILIYG